ncbi:MAG: class I SAM-dependent methyltransferase, partial [bacterium]|nr:class I SAM-dependent methyltransferase [bacterium]
FDLEETMKYSVVVMKDLLEHPLHPMDFFRKAYSLLKDSGLLIVVTPNSTYVTRDRELTLFRVDLEHMQYFSANTFNIIANKIGFEILHLEGLGFPDLQQIDKPYARNAVKRTFKKMLKKMPGFKLAAGLRDMRKIQALRTGNYHLFCILGKKGPGEHPK